MTERQQALLPDDPPRAAYIHVPFCRHRCGYCNFALVADRDDLLESYLAARWRAAATEPDPPREDEAACPLDGGDLGPRLEAFESESVASSTDSSTAASSVERPRSLLSKARAVNGGTRPEPVPAPEALEDSSSSDAGSAEPAEDPAVLAAAQTRLAASEAELAGLLEALAQTRRDVAETRRVVDDESKASVASSIGE